MCSSDLGPLRNALAGTAMALRGSPTGTRTRTEEPGDGALAAPSILARTAALRVVGSIRASTATILAVIGDE